MPAVHTVRFTTSNKDLSKISHKIRDKVFVEEQHVDPSIEYDQFESESYHYLVYLEQKPVATARWRKTTKGIKLERFAVLKEYRNKKLGRQLLDEVLKDVIPQKKPIYLHAQVQVVDFYKQYGFKISGNLFYEADIAHFLMVYNP